MTLLNKAGFIAGAKKLKTKDVEVPGLGTVRVRQLTARQRDIHEQSVYAAREKSGADPEFRARVVAMGVIGEDDKRLFKDEDIQEVSTFGADIIDLLYDEVAGLSGITSKAVEQAEKNSESAPGPSSSSDSPENSERPSANSSPDSRGLTLAS